MTPTREQMEADMEAQIEAIFGPAPIPEPTMRFDIFLVEYGYEVRVYRKGVLVGVECRDLSDSYLVRDLASDLYGRFRDAIESFRTSH